MEEQGEGHNIFMDDWTMKAKRIMLVRFIKHLDEVEGVTAGNLAAIMPELRQRFLVNARSIDIFSDATVLMARKAALTSGARERRMHKERSASLPVTIDMIRELRTLEWVGGDIDRMMCHIGIVLAFNFMLRASEYIMDSSCDEHYIATDDVVYFGEGARQSWRAWEMDDVSRENVHSILFVVRSSKTKKAKYLYLTRGTEMEAQTLEDMVEWAKKAKVEQGDPFTSRRKDGKRKKLTRKMVSKALKRIAGQMGLGELAFAFNPRSLRVGGAASMTAAGEDRNLIKRVGGWSTTSEVDMVYYRNSRHDRGALAVGSMMKTLSTQDVRQLVSPAMLEEIARRQ